MTAGERDRALEWRKQQERRARGDRSLEALLKGDGAARRSLDEKWEAIFWALEARRRNPHPDKE